MRMNDLCVELYSLYGKYFLFDYYNLLFIEIDKDFYYNLKSGEDISSDYHEWIELMLSNGFLREDLATVSLIENQRQLKATISFPSVHSCNLACKYCFAESGANYYAADEQREMVVKKLEDIIDFSCEKYFKSYDILRVDFVSGGEPLLNFDVINHLISNCKEYESKYQKQIEIFLCTNATILNEDIIHIINKGNVSLGISLDGPSYINDKHRVYLDGSSTYSDVLDKIVGIESSNKYTSHTKNLWILGVVTSQTSSLVDILKHHYALGIKNVQMKICRMTKDNILSMSYSNINHFKELYTELTEYLKEEMREGNFDYLAMILNDNDYYGKILRRLLIRDISTRRCSIGRNKLSFTANGDIYPCDSFVGNAEFRLGSIYDENITQSMALSSLNVNFLGNCRECKIKYICGGDCYHNSYLVNGSILKPDSLICEINKHILGCCIDLICYMNAFFSEKLDRITNILAHKR